MNTSWPTQILSQQRKGFLYFLCKGKNCLAFLEGLERERDNFRMGKDGPKRVLLEYWKLGHGLGHNIILIQGWESTKWIVKSSSIDTTWQAAGFLSLLAGGESTHSLRHSDPFSSAVIFQGKCFDAHSYQFQLEILLLFVIKIKSLAKGKFLTCLYLSLLLYEVKWIILPLQGLQFKKWVDYIKY